MSIWTIKPELKALNARSSGTMLECLGIRFISFGDDYLEASMPVDERTRQPMGLLHGGASGALAETLGSVASVLVAGDQVSCVGIELNASHLKSVKSGEVIGRVSPIRLGKSLHVWEISIRSADPDKPQELCRSRLSVMIVRPTA